MQMNKLNFNFQSNIKVETALIYWRWIDVILPILPQRCFINVETTSMNIPRLNFHFQPNFNVETTSLYQRLIDVTLAALFQRYFANFATTSINVRRLDFHFQPNINVETTLTNVDDQRCFNVESTLMCLLGQNYFLGRPGKPCTYSKVFSLYWIGVYYKFILKSVKSLNIVFWAMEYCFKALQCQIESTNTKPFFWENEACLPTLQKLSPYIGVCYKFALRSLKSLSRIFWPMEYWIKAIEYQIWSMNTKPNFWESKSNLGTLQKRFPYIEVLVKFVSKSVKSLNWIFPTRQ